MTTKARISSPYWHQASRGHSHNTGRGERWPMPDNAPPVALKPNYCVVCKTRTVDAQNGFDTCADCLAKQYLTRDSSPMRRSTRR